MDPRIQIELHGRLKGVAKQIGKKDAHDEPDIDGGDRLNSFPRSKSVNHDNGRRRQHDSDEEQDALAS